MIEQQRIDTIKESVDLAPFIKACGVDLKQSGKSYKGHCPFHEDKKSPSLSVTPSEKLWQCFGCGKGGDVIDFAKECYHRPKVDPPTTGDLTHLAVIYSLPCGNHFFFKKPSNDRAKGF